MDEIELSDQYYRRVISGREGTHLADSRRTSGAFAAGELDDETNQVTDSSEWVEVPRPDDRSGEVAAGDSDIDRIITCVLAAVGTAVFTYTVTNYAHPWWVSRGRPALGRTWRKLTHLSDETAESSTSQETDEVIGAEVTPADMRIAVERLREHLGEEEAQRELLNVLAHASAIAASLRRLSDATIGQADEDASLEEWRKAFESLATAEVAACIAALLDKAGTDDELASQLAKLLDVQEDDLQAMRTVDGQKVAEVLRLPEG